MILKIFNRGRSRGEGPINYLLGEKFLSDGIIREGATVLSGDAYLSQELINSSNFAKRYTAGVLSFEERPDQVTAEVKQQIMQDFERVMFPGMQPDRYYILWVEHTDKAHPQTKAPRLELNFLIATTELYTGKRLQPYYHVQDAKYFRAWQTLANARFEFTDPDDPVHFRHTNLFESNQSPKKNHEKIKTRIATYLEKKLAAGMINHRDDVIAELEQMGDEQIKVTRRSEKFISVVSKDSQKPIRLKGFLFEKDFSYQDYLLRLQNNPDDHALHKKIETIASKQQRVDQARETFNHIYAHKRELNIKKYQIPAEELAWVDQHYCPYDRAHHDNNGINHPFKNDLENTRANKMEATVQVDMSPEATDTLSYEPTLEEMALANAKQKAKQKEEEKLKLQRQLEDERLQAYMQQQQERQRRQAVEAKRLMPIYGEIKNALRYCYSNNKYGYDLGLQPLKDLIENNFMKTLAQRESDFFDTVRLSVGRFASTFHVTRDGRVGVDFSLYSNINQFKYFYSSDLFEIKADRLYVKQTDTYYELSKFKREERALIEESIANSQQNKLAVWSNPEGLEDALITYQADLKTLPGHNLDHDRFDKKDTSDSRLDNDTSSTPRWDDEGPGF